MESLFVTHVTYWLPAGGYDDITLENDAVANGEIICLRDPGHSIALANSLKTGKSPSKPYRYLLLSNLSDAKTIGATIFKVDAGGHLSYDPYERTPATNPSKSTLENSCCLFLDGKGLSVSFYLFKTNNPTKHIIR